MVIVSLFFWDWMWGVPGALLSVPLLAVMKIVCDRLPAWQRLGTCWAQISHMVE